VLLLASLAWPSDLEAWFPSGIADDAAQRARLVEVQGPPARMYDAVTATPSAATDTERAIEALVVPPGLAQAPDSLRCFGRAVLAMSRLGPVPAPLELFAAENCGLPLWATTLGRFVGSDPAATGRNLGHVLVDDDTLQAEAVVLEPIENGYRGIVVGMLGSARFQPFPRVWAAGDAPSVPGAPMRRDRTYALFVAGAGTDVKSYPLAATEGVFDVDIPVAAAEGAWTVTMNALKRDHFPDSAFFFTLYVGQEPPTTPPELPEAPSGDILPLLNAERVRVGLAPLEAGDDGGNLRRLLATLPPREVEWVRRFRQLGETDPLPGQPHGTWTGMSAAGANPAEIAWLLTHHPVNREALLDPMARYAVIADVPTEGGTQYVALLFRPAAGRDEVRAMVVDALGSRFAAPPRRDPVFEARLDTIAQRVASGEETPKAALKDAGKELGEMQHAGAHTGPGMVSILSFDPAQGPNTSSVTPAPGANSLCVGVGTGTLGHDSGNVNAVAIIYSSVEP
jgi:hypothetical protein